MTERVPDVSPDLPGPAWRITLALLERLPQAALSRGFGALADTPVPRPLRRVVIGGFARAMGIDVAEAEQGVSEYRSINEFFVRRLRPGVRTWPDDDGVAASPVDGVIGQHGRILRGRLIQAKGRDYSAADLLQDATGAARYDAGAFLTIYLSPRHYHRIHAPVGGTVAEAVHVPGALLPVNAPAVMHVQDLFPRNERVACTIDSPLGRVCVVAVGAYNVGRISTAFDPAWVGPGVSVANRKGVTQAQRRSYDPPLTLAQGDELMAFHLGSTIVMLFEPGTTVTAAAPGTEVRLGSPVARRG
ncbi:MAG TPA: archaetidylserine decarboxylase [Longimicrobiales bacterium]|nr:archaetidylserine decarboxylase [Longimicrobiales bacterium]